MLSLEIVVARCTLAFIFLIGASLGVLANDRATCDKESGEHAIAACTRLIQRGGMNAKNLATTYSNRGNEYIRLQDFERAIRDFDQAIALFQASIFYSNRGLAYMRTGQQDLALSDYTQAIRLDSRNFFPRLNRAVIWFLRKDLDKTIEDLDRAVALNPKSGFALNGRGRAYQAKGDLTRALADYDRAIALEPRYSRTYSSRGDIWRFRGDYDKAIADYSKAISINPQDPEPYPYRALAREAKGEYREAISDYRTALALPRFSSQGSYFDDNESSHAMAKSRLSLIQDAGDAPPSAPALPPSSPKPAPAKETPGRKAALVIGNGAYANVSRLANPVNDAHLIAKNLKSIGFEVSSWEDLDRDAMKQKVADFLRGAVTARIAVVFYAGHGMQIDGKNYLVPIDADLEKDDKTLISQMVDMDFILSGLDDNIRTNIVVLDACRNNPLADSGTNKGRSVRIRSGLASPSGLAGGTTMGAGTLLAFATAPGQVAADGEGENSPFSNALGRHIGTPGLEIQQMLTRVRSEVVASTKSKQVPWSNSSLLGEVYLAGGN